MKGSPKYGVPLYTGTPYTGVQGYSYIGVSYKEVSLYRGISVYGGTIFKDMVAGKAVGLLSLDIAWACCNSETHRMVRRGEGCAHDRPNIATPIYMYIFMHI